MRLIYWKWLCTEKLREGTRSITQGAGNRRCAPAMPGSSGRYAQADQPLERLDVVRKLARSGAVRDLAALEDHCFFGEREGDPDVLFDQDRGGSLLGHHAPDRPRQFFHDDGCESLERLVEQQERRVRHESARDREHLLLASGELVAHIRLALGEARKQFVYSLQVPAPGTRRHGQVLLERQRRENLALLRDPAQTPARP